ncbi:PepSY domain-containing protein [Colwellia sp. E150_009]
MKRLNSIISITLATLITAGTVSTSWAGSDKEELTIAKSIIAKSGVTAQQAIRKVQQEYNGVIYSYDLDDEDDIYYHEIKLIDIEADKKIKLIISIQNGEVVKKEWHRLFSWFFDDERIVTARKLATMKYSILDAIDAIALDESSLLQEIEIEDKQGVLFFELETIDDNGEKDWLVDANNNQIIPVFKK